MNERFAVLTGRGLRGNADQRTLVVALDGDDRMDDEVQRQAMPVDLHRHRVDEERHVVVDDLDDRVRRLPAVAARRIEDAHARLPGLPSAREVPVRQGRAEVVR